MFEDLRAFSRIVVSGPHRSGTTITAEMIAADTGHEVVREEAFGCSNEARFAECLKREHVVLQAPFMAHRLHYLHEIVDSETLYVVFLLRDLEEIRRSQEHMVNDHGSPTGAGIARYRLRQLHTRNPDPLQVYVNWSAQKPRIPHWREVHYSSLRGHPRWVDDRSRFTYRQTA